MLGLTWADVNVQGRTIRIARQLDRWGNRSDLKTKRSRRTIAISPALAARLAEHRLSGGATMEALWKRQNAANDPRRSHEFGSSAGDSRQRAVERSTLGLPGG